MTRHQRFKGGLVTSIHKSFQQFAFRQSYCRALSEQTARADRTKHRLSPRAVWSYAGLCVGSKFSSSRTDLVFVYLLLHYRRRLDTPSSEKFRTAGQKRSRENPTRSRLTATLCARLATDRTSWQMSGVTRTYCRICRSFRALSRNGDQGGSSIRPSSSGSSSSGTGRPSASTWTNCIRLSIQCDG